MHPAAKTRRELLTALADFKAISLAYCAAAEYLADQGRDIFTSPMNGGLWNGRILDACIMSKKEGDNAAYEFLLKFGDQYASTLPTEQQRQWQNIQDIAADMLKRGGGQKGVSTESSPPNPHTS